MGTTLEVLRTGPLALVEDLGRPGLAHMGVTRSGAADRRSHTLANRLVANPGESATIEVTFGGFSARVCGGDVAIAVTGADTDPAVNGIPFGTNSIHHVHDGQVISGRTAFRTAQLPGGAGRHRRHPGSRLTQLRRHVGDRAVAPATW